MNHIFNVEVAVEHGVEVSILAERMLFLIKKNQANNKHFHDGCYWIHSSIRAFRELFPYWSERQINRILNSMRDKGLIQAGNYNKSAYDRTLWYAFTKTFCDRMGWKLWEENDVGEKI